MVARGIELTRVRRAAVLLVLLTAGCGSNEAAETVTETITTTTTVIETTTTAGSSDKDAELSFEGFQTPSGNIECVVALQVGYSFMRCEIREVDDPPPQPADCTGDWGHSIQMGAGDPADWACVSDAMPADHPPITLAYEEKWRYGAFECRSLRIGVRCTNAVGHRLFLSREQQRFSP
jgi:hypothetical protein